jgi:Vam6/Vps39-like protein vacuolar protein sorting-associated protein 39
MKELALPHSPRAMAFPTPKTIAMAYTQTDHAILYMETMSTAEVNLPTTVHPSTSAVLSTGLSGAVGLSMNAFSGLGGYMKSGLLGQAKPTVIKTAEGEFVIPKDSSYSQRLSPNIVLTFHRLERISWDYWQADKAFGD